MAQPSVEWRKSSYSGSGGSCVELADLGDEIAVRNSNRITAGTLTIDRAAIAGFVAACKAGKFDDLAR